MVFGGCEQEGYESQRQMLHLWEGYGNLIRWFGGRVKYESLGFRVNQVEEFRVNYQHINVAVSVYE